MPAGAVVFKEGDLGRSFYIVLEGEVDVLKRDYVQGLDEKFTEMKAGDFFGQAACRRYQLAAIAYAICPSTTGELESSFILTWINWSASILNVCVCVCVCVCACVCE